MSVIVVGLNHRSAPLELLERVSVSPARLPKALAALRARDSLNEVVLLSTCMRTEIYASVERFHPAVQEIRDYLCEFAFAAPEDVVDYLSVLYDDAAMAHLFTVTAGLDSAVLGETEIQAQVRRAWDEARAQDVSGPVLDALFRRALEVGKRVRSETSISRGTTSVSQAAVSLAAHHLGGSLEGRRVLVLGAGDMGKGMATALAKVAGVADVVVANRTRARAEVLAERTGGRAMDVTELSGALVDIDVVLTSTTAEEAILTVDDVVPVLAARAARHANPLLIVDVGIPRDVEPAVAELDGVSVLDLDDLRAFAEAGLASRRREVGRASHIIDGEVEDYLAEASARNFAPTISALYTRGESIRTAELDRYRARLEGLDERQREALEAVTRGIVAKLLHVPAVRLKGASNVARGDRLAEALRVLFDLDG